MARKWSIVVKASEENSPRVGWLTWREDLSGLDTDIDNCIADGYTKGRISIVMEKPKRKKVIK